MSKTISRQVFAGIAAIASLSAGNAVAQETINVTAMSGYSEQASWVRVFKEFWIPEVNARLAETGNYEIEYVEAFGTVVQPRGEFEATQNGLANLGLIVPIFHVDRVPLAAVSYVTPFTSVDAELNARIHDEIAAEIPAYREAFEEYDMELLASLSTIMTYVVLSREPIESLDDFEGLKVSGAGLNLRWLEGLGTTGVPSAVSRMYQDVDSGVTDAMIAWPDAITSFKLCEAAPYVVSADIGAVTAFAIAANKPWFESLPEEVRNVMREVAPEFRDELSRQSTEGNARGLEACVEQGGTIRELSAEERETWAQSIPDIAREWADELDAQGLPGSEVLSSYMNRMREANQPIARDWDRE